MPKPNPLTDFIVNVPGVGEFTFAKRNMRSAIMISAEYHRLIGTKADGSPAVQGDVPAALERFAGAMSDLAVLTVSAPVGWDAADLDPYEEESYGKLLAVWEALRETEGTFRKSRTVSKEAGKEPARDVPVVVPESV